MGITQNIRPTPIQEPYYSVLHVTESNPYAFLKVSETFRRALTSSEIKGRLGSPLVYDLPRALVKEIQRVEMLMIDSLLWTRELQFRDYTLVELIEEFEERTQKGDVRFWPPEVLAESDEEGYLDVTAKAKIKYPSAADDDYAQYRSVSYILRRVLRTAHSRITALCNFLAVPIHIPLVHQVYIAFRYMLRSNLDVVFERHLDHWILCCLYGVAKALKYSPELTFAKIINAYVVVRGHELGDVSCAIPKHACLCRSFTDHLSSACLASNH